MLKSVLNFCNAQNSEHVELVLQKVVNSLISEFRQNVFFYSVDFKDKNILLPFEVAYIFEVRIDGARVDLFKLEDVDAFCKGVVLLDFERFRVYGFDSGTLELTACAFWDKDSDDIPLPSSFANAILSGCEVALRHHHFDNNQLQFLQMRYEEDKNELRAFYNRATTKAGTFSQNVKI